MGRVMVFATRIFNTARKTHNRGRRTEGGGLRPFLPPPFLIVTNLSVKHRLVREVELSIAVLDEPAASPHKVMLLKHEQVSPTKTLTIAWSSEEAC